MNIFQILLIQPLANGLILFYNILGQNLGLAILGFSVFLKVLMSPLTRRQMQSAKKMRDLKPRLDKLKLKYKGDKTKLMQAQADLYKEFKINPMGSFLPLIAQMVVLFAFFSVFNKTLSSDSSALENLNNLLYPFLRFPQEHVINTNFLGLDLSKPNVTTYGVLPIAVPGPLIILAAIAQFVSAKIMAPLIKKEEKIAKGTPEKSDDMEVAMAKSTTITLPLITLFFGMQFAAGLALYWLAISLFQAYDQYRTSGWGGLTPTINRVKRVFLL
ncbi:MAG: Membrane protein insertase, YidC/Oxa1 family [Candidatus Woesebacteria bacterium GW2011_GWB1_38_5b]|uniref:Membrane protein insertase, YidC/Oxa1 family n=1 Tax=Candidatus Woesebacteria bacterium GW2011_GWB1_38_5b TaxID=1618569 RepID=A0A0G0K5G5_9BACT|nr:MAG: Membrane protein insertase, YidC/Oxa1 family [Candidatus Woesebacteria bacterium GW2011_GWB1_38_5b]